MLERFPHRIRHRAKTHKAYESKPFYVSYDEGQRPRMYQEAFEKLELDETAQILDRVSPLLEGVTFDPVETTILAAEIPFYPGCKLLDVANHTTMPPQRRFVIYSTKHATVINFHNECIYKFNDDLPIKLDENNVGTYVRFFFTYVRGKHGRFIVVENIDDINWKEDPPPSARQAISRMIKPVSLTKEIGKDGVFHLEARIVFKDSLFKSKVVVQPNGLVTLSDEELLVEDMPVLDDTFGQ